MKLLDTGGQDVDGEEQEGDEEHVQEQELPGRVALPQPADFPAENFIPPIVEEMGGQGGEAGEAGSEDAELIAGEDIETGAGAVARAVTSASNVVLGKNKAFTEMNYATAQKSSPDGWWTYDYGLWTSVGQEGWSEAHADRYYNTANSRVWLKAPSYEHPLWVDGIQSPDAGVGRTFSVTGNRANRSATVSLNGYFVSDLFVEVPDGATDVMANTDVAMVIWNVTARKTISTTPLNTHTRDRNGESDRSVTLNGSKKVTLKRNNTYRVYLRLRTNGSLGSIKTDPGAVVADGTVYVNRVRVRF
jgi:hypothetical protein